MKTVILQRIKQGASGTFGIMTCDGPMLCCTLELDWDDNLHLESCIPAGTYQVTWKSTPRFPNGVYQLDNVPNRDGIDIHAANTIDDVEGCIGVGLQFGKLKNRSGNIVDGILQSRVALEKLREAVGDQFTLTVIDEHPK